MRITTLSPNHGGHVRYWGKDGRGNAVGAYEQQILGLVMPFAETSPTPLWNIVREAAERFDAKPIERASVAARAELKATAKVSTSRRFLLVREEDVSGTSGTGVVAEGVEFSSGRVALTWRSEHEVGSFYANVKTVLRVHGHEGRTTIEWVDP